MIIYTDNILLMAESAVQVTLHLEALLYLLIGLEFIINVPKSLASPTQKMEFLGFQVYSSTLRLSLPGEKKGGGDVNWLRSCMQPKQSFQFPRDLQRVLNSSHQNYTTLFTLSP